MRRDVQEVFRMTPHLKQVMMFSETLAQEIRFVCNKFMVNVRLRFHVFPHITRCPTPAFGDFRQLTLHWHGLQQYYVKLDEVGKNRKLNELPDTLELN